MKPWTKTSQRFYVEARDGTWFTVSEHRLLDPALRSRARFLRTFDEYRPRSVRVLRVEQVVAKDRVDDGKRPTRKGTPR